MNIDELDHIEAHVKRVLHTADSQGWPEDHYTRVLANLIQRAVTELRPAPALLAALTDLLAWANIGDHHSPQAVAIRDAARAAIAAARGKATTD